MGIDLPLSLKSYFMLVVQLIFIVLILMLCAVITLAVVSYRAIKTSQEGDITEIFPKIFNPLGISVGIINEGDGEWDIVYTDLE